MTKQITMKYLITISSVFLLLFALPLQSSAQNPKKADKVYEDFGYKTSIPLFEATIDKKGMREAEISKIANSYRLIHDTENAEKWYEEAPSPVRQTADKSIEI